jgi:hypothetical protein
MALQVEIQQELSGVLCPNPLKLLGKGFNKVKEVITQKISSAAAIGRRIADAKSQILFFLFRVPKILLVFCEFICVLKF